VRPVIKPALRRLWRGEAAIQLGTDPARAVVLDGVGDTANAVLALMDGTRDADEVVAAAAAQGIDGTDVRTFLGLLDSVQALDDASIAPHGYAPLHRERLDPDLSSLSLLAARPGGGARLLDTRRATTALVVGAGRVGSLVASLLGAAGLGHVVIRDPGTATVADSVPGGVCPADDGEPRAIAAVAAAQRAGAASVEGAVRPPNVIDCRDADVAVVASDSGLAPPPVLLDLFVGARLPYLVTTVRETYGVVGPFVLPGRTACPRCLDLHRASRDPGWPVVAAQLVEEDRNGGTPACDVALAAGVAALAAGQVLAHLMGPGRTRALNATLELRLPEWTVRRRPWSTHPSCPCEAAVAAEREAAARRLTEIGDATSRRGRPDPATTAAAR
jgi:bacteriocin biosynthesis cyclodehydratase domain-containing protein